MVPSVTSSPFLLHSISTCSTVSSTITSICCPRICSAFSPRNCFRALNCMFSLPPRLQSYASSLYASIYWYSLLRNWIPPSFPSLSLMHVIPLSSEAVNMTARRSPAAAGLPGPSGALTRLWCMDCPSTSSYGVSASNAPSKFLEFYHFWVNTFCCKIDHGKFKEQ